MTNVIKFTPPEPVDFSYIVDEEDGEIVGVQGEQVSMAFFESDAGFLFNDVHISRNELIAFVLVSGIWQDVQDN